MKHYSNKSNARRAALTQGENLDNITFVQATEGWYWEPIELEQAMATAIAEVDTSAEDAALAQLRVEEDARLVHSYGSATCPHCEVHLSNGVLRHGDVVNDKPVQLTQEFECMACGGTFGELIDTPAATPAKQKTSQNKGNGLKIEKDRAEQNGVTRPSKGGVCAQLWEMFDAMYGEKGIVPTPNPAKARSGEMGISPVTTTVQLYQWRAFMGFKGR